MKNSQRFLDSKDGSKFLWLPWFPAHEVLGQHLCTGLWLQQFFVSLRQEMKQLDKYQKRKETQEET